jgi:hypothetical protein
MLALVSFRLCSIRLMATPRCVASHSVSADITKIGVTPGSTLIPDLVKEVEM